MNGDVWLTKDGRKGLEVGRTEKTLMLSIMKPDWPFPDSPVAFFKKDCQKLPSRYHNNEVVEDALL